MSNSPKICIPPLNVSVVSVETMPVNIQSINSLPGTAGRLHLGKLAQQLIGIDENYCTESKPFVSCVPLQQNATPVYGVQLQPEQFLCVSCLHPNLLQGVGRALVTTDGAKYDTNFGSTCSAFARVAVVVDVAHCVFLGHQFFATVH